MINFLAESFAILCNVTTFVVLAAGLFIIWTGFIYAVLLKYVILSKNIWTNFLVFIRVRKVFETWLPEWKSDKATKYNAIVRMQIIHEMHYVFERQYLMMKDDKVSAEDMFDNNVYNLLKLVGSDKERYEEDILESLRHYSETGELKNDRLNANSN